MAGRFLRVGDFIDDFRDFLGVVEYADHAAEVGEALYLSLLEGAWLFAGGFYFDEADLALGEDDEAVWHAGVCWAG